MDADLAAGLAAQLKALGDPVRLRLVSIVASSPRGEACVCDLLPAFDLSQPTVSHHLKVLREAGLLTCERRGSWVWYRVVPAALAQLTAALTPVDDAAAGGAEPVGAELVGAVRA
ncbi:metalloregulator ArsR/SmtB family transcription factor [Pseudokineococcus basanitobsidens]|uniref:Metalloregulator ArsR/SmtB family transcription factor n=1 Tax=Pseudokineococcus basanitobsidens TaxID=1926649 RepID=A0ABU8RN08_9ACTN